MATNTTSTLSANLPSEYYRKKLLTIFDETLQLYKLGEKMPLPKNSGKVVKWLSYVKLSANTTALTEGVVPSDTSLTTENITATVAQYGGYTKISDFLNDTAIDPVVESATERMARQGAITIDTLCRDELAANMQIQYANGKASLATTGSSDVVVAKELLKAAITLKKSAVLPKMGQDYVAVVHPACLGDIHNDTNIGGFNDITKYSDNTPLMNGEIGKAYGVRVMLSHNIGSTASGTLGSATVYSNLILGDECLGVVDLGGDNVKLITNKAGSAGSLDPLNQIGTVAWKAQFVAKYLKNSSGVHRGVVLKAGSGF